MTYPGIFVLSRASVADLLAEDRPRIGKGWLSDGGGWAEYCIGRQFWTQEYQQKVLAGGDMTAIFVALSAERLRGFQAIVGMNEYISEAHDNAAWKEAISIEKAMAARAFLAGLDYWAFSMPTHNLPPMSVVEELAKDKNVTGLVLHLYSLERPMQVETEVARYRAFIEACPLPVLIGETGRDGIGRNIGWQQQGVSAKDFAEEMRWLTQNIGAWGYTVFCYGATEDWK